MGAAAAKETYETPMTSFMIILMISLLLGQFGRIDITPGIALYIHDIVIFIFIRTAIAQKKFSLKYIHTLSSFDKSILLFIGASLLSLIVNAGKYPAAEVLYGSLYLVRFIFYCSLYGVIAYGKYIHIDWIYGLFFYGVSLATIGFLQFILYPDLGNLSYLGWDPHYRRLFSTLLDPNFTGIILLLTFILGLNIIQKNPHRRFIMLLESVIFIALLLTYSRSTYAAAFIAFLYIGFVSKKPMHLLLPALFLISVCIIPRSGAETVSLLRTTTSAARIGNWKQSVLYFQESPVFGHGFNMLRSIQEPNWITQTSRTSHAAGGLDNSFLFVAATTGVLGFLFFASMIYNVVKTGIILLHRKQTRSWGIFFLCSIIAVCIHSFFVNSIFYPQVLIWILILTGYTKRIITSGT